MDQNPPHSSYTSFPILAISILGILTTAILLLSYHIFVIKCCLNWSRSDLLFRFSHSCCQFTSQILRRGNEEARGLDSSTINSIPTFRFIARTNSTLECVVCLINFQEQELLRLLPNCKHLFHIDCIDTWHQSNPNCPLCRTEISLLPILQFSGSDSSSNSALRDEDSSVVIEVRDSWRFWDVKSKGDECINTREKDERFVVQPMRRSFSMDSSNDRGLYASVQEVLRHNSNFVPEGSSSINSSGSNGGRIRRSLFPFGRSSRNASVLSVQREFL